MKEKILIALGDIVLANSIEHELSKLNYRTAVVVDGNKVLDECKSFSPDLIVIDLNLSGRSGYEILFEKSFDRFLTKIPVLIVSNSGAALEMKRIPSTPTIKGYVVKAHIEPNEVVKKVGSIFGREILPKKEIHGDDHPKTIAKNVLWVEDDKLLSVILSKKFVKAGFNLLKASNSDEAFGFLEKHVPDIVILDILLPGMNGMDILQKIRTMDKYKNLPVIILSNMNTQDYIDRAKTLGAKKFIVKAAASLDEIVREVKEVLGIK